MASAGLNARVASARARLYPGPHRKARGSGPSLDETLPSLEQRVEADPTDVKAWQALGTAYVRGAAETGDPSFYGLAERAFDRHDRAVALAEELGVAVR